jgi:CheY-like chemotaxis protein
MVDPARTHPILVVDDDRDIRDSLIEVLEGEGYQVASAGNGQEALDYLKDAAPLPAVILLDIMMPLMNGIQFRVEQKKNLSWSKIAVIVMTAIARGELASKLDGVELDGTQIDGMQYLRKPIDLRTLLELVASAAT